MIEMRFEGSSNYIATADLMLAVNAAITLQRPLLIKGEPGTGKTMLAEEVARTLNLPLLQWHIKSTTKAQQGLYEYDAVSRLRDSQLGDDRVKDIANYIVKGVLWQAFEADTPTVVLIDEIDKADIEFPNDLLRELDRMEFHVYETRQTVRARHRRSSPPTTKRNCPTPSCAAASFTTSSSPTGTPCRPSWTCTSPD
jgi:MoxR-like ATPase